MSSTGSASSATRRTSSPRATSSSTTSPSSRNHVAAVVLAAGAATRYGSPKQCLFLPAILDALAASALGDVVVVTGAHAVEADARVVHCPEWEQGPGASLRCGPHGLAPE